MLKNSEQRTLGDKRHHNPQIGLITKAAEAGKNVGVLTKTHGHDLVLYISDAVPVLIHLDDLDGNNLPIVQTFSFVDTGRGTLQIMQFESIIHSPPGRGCDNACVW